MKQAEIKKKYIGQVIKDAVEKNKRIVMDVGNTIKIDGEVYLVIK
jgi:hypothetical protein